jgi:hypothetical protein
MATWSVTRWASSMIKLPHKAVVDAKNIIRKARRAKGLGDDDTDIRILTGLDNLDPNNQVLKVLESMPLDERIRYHSIIGDLDAPGKTDGTDGVVSYRSSHLDVVESELIIQSDHGAHTRPPAAEEVHRILMENLAMPVTGTPSSGEDVGKPDAAR